MPTKLDYSKLDAALLEVIRRSQPITFSGLYHGRILSLASELAAQSNREAKEAHQRIDTWRMVDRRLQALRKAGRIKHSRNPEGWTEVAEGA